MNHLLRVFILSVVSGASCFADSLDKHARATELVPPTYPPNEKREGRGGIATIIVRVDAKGVASVQQVMGTLEAFAIAAKSSALKWKFDPSRRDNRAAPDVLEFVVIFDATKGVEILGPLYRE